MKVNFNSDNHLPLNKTIVLHMTIVVRSVFHEANKNYLQVFYMSIFRVHKCYSII